MIGAAAARAVLIVVLLGKKPDEKPAFMSDSTGKVIQRRGFDLKYYSKVWASLVLRMRLN